MHRSQMTGQERECRSRLKSHISYRGLLKGSLTMRKHTCGKPNCKCAKGKYKHSSLYLTGRGNGRREQLFIPKKKEEAVKGWVDNYRIVQGLLEKISSTYWDRLKKER